jgi:hypothetical protein
VDKRLITLLPLAVLAFVIWYVYSNRGLPNVTVDERAVEPAYRPFDHWMIQRPGGYVRHYPDRVGPACLGEIVQNEDQGALSTSQAGIYAAEEYANA